MHDECTHLGMKHRTRDVKLKCTSIRLHTDKEIKMDQDNTKTQYLCRRISSISDRTVRIEYLRNMLHKMSVEEIGELIDVTRKKTESHCPLHSELLLCISLALADQSCDALRNSIVELFNSNQHYELSRMFDREVDNSGSEPQRIPDFGFGRPLTLGERKSLARRNDRNLIAKVIEDPEPSVIQLLLNNPSLTESDVVRLCARRPILPIILREVFMSGKWISQYRVKVTIALNPHTPIDVSLQIIPHLNLQDLSRIAASQELSIELRNICNRRDSSHS